MSLWMIVDMYPYKSLSVLTLLEINIGRLLLETKNIGDFIQFWFVVYFIILILNESKGKD